MKLVRRLAYTALSLLLFSSVMWPIAKVHATGAWETYGPSPISSRTINYPQLKFTKNGTPYIAYIDPGTEDINIDDDTLVVKRFNGTSWESLGGGPVPDAKPGSLDMVLSPTNVPYVAYTDYDHSNKLSVQRFDGTSWHLVGSAGFSTTQPDSHSMALDSHDHLFVAFGAMDGEGEKPVVQHFNGTSWDVVGSSDITEEEPSVVVQLAVTSTDVPYIVYQDYASYSTKLVAKRYNGSEWEYVGTPGFTPGHGLPESLVMSADDKPYVSFFDNGSGNKTSVMQFDSNDWEYVGSPGFTTGVTFNSRLALTSAGTPYVSSYNTSNDNKDEVWRFNGADWELVGSAGFTPGAGAFPAMGFDARDIPYVIYGDEIQGYKLTMQRFIDGPDQLDDPSMAVLSNAETQDPISVNTSFGTTLTCSGVSKESSLAKQDSGYSYPLGLVRFCFDTDFTSNTATLVFVTDLKPDEVVVRKYNSTTESYANIDSAEISQTTYNGKPALSARYTISDNGPLDQNPDAGAVSDPVGLATVTDSKTGTLADTGSAIILPHTVAGLLLLGSGLSFVIYKKSHS